MLRNQLLSPQFCLAVTCRGISHLQNLTRSVYSMKSDYTLPADQRVIGPRRDEVCWVLGAAISATPRGRYVSLRRLIRRCISSLEIDISGWRTRGRVGRWLADRGKSITDLALGQRRLG